MESMDIEKQAIVLLTSYFKSPSKDSPNPLTPTEWKSFAGWLVDKRYTPGSLLSEDGINIIESWTDKKITKERLIALLRRGAQMSLAIEKWSRAGIWILTRSDPDYPQKLKNRLGTISPPILFGTGNKQLLNIKGIAVVGSRDITDEDINFSRELGGLISMNDYAVISGGAKGVDETAMLGSLESGGNAVGVLGDGLFQKSLSQIYRKYLTEGNLVLVSPYYPEAGFSVGNAMGRNKYIYSLSEAAIVVHSGLKGGTWTGANENLNKQWVPLFVKENYSKDSGNMILLNSGAKKLNNYDFKLFNIDALNKNKKLTDQQFSISKVYEPQQELKVIQADTELSKKTEKDLESIDSKSFYDFFVIKLNLVLKEKERTSNELKEKFELTASQLKEWLLRAEKENIIKKISKPVRYKLIGNMKEQTDLFN